ncbi:MAG: hypothetical protein GWP39_08085 [Planctomycetia bacterium]|jgi:polyhydroxybutyrate depolymerase|nr:hypothetical protein [Planctomycetia bacterium]
MFQKAHALPLVATLLLLGVGNSEKAWSQVLESIDIGRGPITVEVSDTYTPTQPAPLVILLHGRAWDGESMENYFSLSSEANQRGYVYCYPDGLATFTGVRYWNATNACCCQGFPFTTCDDDVAYLSLLISSLQSNYNIDSSRVHIVGHSNGGFMAHRMACERPDLLTSIVSVSGMTWSDPANCTPNESVPVLQIHGTIDPVIFYGGGILGAGVYPSAQETCESWAAINGCNSSPQIMPSIDINASVSGAETDVLRWDSACTDDASVELWSVSLSGHLPNFNSNFVTGVFDHMENSASSPENFIRGDANEDLSINLADAVQILQYLFGGQAISCLESANANSDASLDLSDAVYLLLHLFSSGAAPGAPHPACGTALVSVGCISGSCP